MRLGLILPSIVLAAATPAFADEPPAPAAETTDVVATDDATTDDVTTSDVTSDVEAAVGRSYGASLAVLEPRSYAKDWLVAPPGWTFGGEMRFVTADSSLFGSGQGIRFADLAVLRLETRITASKRLELSGAIDLLAKQPDGSEEPIPQGGSLGFKLATSRKVALAAGVSGGPTLGTGGMWGTAGAGLIHRSRIEEFIAFQVGAGTSVTTIHRTDMDSEWQADVVGSSELVFHTPRGEWAMWGGFGLALPAVHSDGIDPSTRLDVTIGTVFSAVRDWDLYAAFTLRDRGTTEMPGTVLPIVDGGFDQKQIVIGITRRFTERGASRWALSQ